MMNQSASNLVKHFGFEHYKLYLDAKKIHPIIEEIINTCDEPLRPSAIPIYVDC